jgi:hypothetical protein
VAVEIQMETAPMDLAAAVEQQTLEEAMALVDLV